MNPIKAADPMQPLVKEEAGPVSGKPEKKVVVVDPSQLSGRIYSLESDNSLFNGVRVI